MSNRLVLIYLAIVIVIVIALGIFIVREPYQNKYASLENIKKELQEAIKLSKKIQEDDTIPESEKIIAQQKVNLLLQEITQQAINIDNNGKSYSKELNKITPQKFKSQLDNFLQTILMQWQEHNLTLTTLAQKQLHEIFKQRFNGYFPKQLVKTINSAIADTVPLTITPKWLKEIDDFFAQEHTTKHKYSSLLSNQYNTLIALSLPFVSYEQIIQLKSFDDDIVSKNSFQTLNIPRDLNETKRLYSAILSLPKEYIVHSLVGTNQSKQPFKAQMLMVELMKNPHKNQELHTYLKETILSAPDYLFDYPKIDGGMDIAHSSQPAQNMVYNNHSVELNELIYQKSSLVFKKEFDELKSYQDKQEKYKQIISTTLPNDNRTITQRVEETQMEFAKLLESFDLILKEHNLNLPPPLNDEQIEKLQKYLTPFKLPKEYITLYKWHNGMDERLYMYLPAQESFRDYTMLQEEIEYHGDWWSKNLFPLNSFNGDTYWFLDLNNSNSSAIHYIWLEGADLEKKYNSIEDMIKIYIKAFKEKIIYYDERQEEIIFNEEAFNKLKE